MLAGILASGSESGELRGDVLRGLAGEGRPRVIGSHALAIGTTGGRRGEPAQSRRFLVVLEGRLDNADRVRRDLGMEPESALEDLLLSAYERWKEGMLARLRGAFILLVWDRKAERGVLAVDQLGAGSLFLREGRRSLIFASESRILLRMVPQRPAPDRLAVIRWLGGGQLERGQTLYEGVRRLEGGHFLRLSGGAWENLEYWAPRFGGTLKVSFGEAARLVRRELSRAVEARLAPDGATGILLSGGIDSSSVAAVAAGEAGGEGIHAYSAVFPRFPAVDEGGLIEETVRRLELPDRRIVVEGGSMLAGLLEFVRTWEWPSQTPNLLYHLPLYRVAAADGMDVLLDGEGGDELFGVSPYLIADRLARGRVVGAARLGRRLPGAGDASIARVLRQLVFRDGLKGAVPPALHDLVRSVRGPRYYHPPWFRPQIARTYLDSTNPWAWKRNPGPRWWAYLSDRLTGLKERVHGHDLLRRQTHMSGGIEGRHPFLDDLGLIELMLKLPPELAFDPRFSRPLLRAAVDGELPESVRLRPTKSYFTTFVSACLDGSDRDLVRELLSSSTSEIASYVRPDLVQAYLLNAPSERRRGPWAAAVWRLIGVECWLRFEADRAFPEHALAGWNLEPARYDITSVGNAPWTEAGSGTGLK